MLVQGFLYPVFADAFGKVAVMLVKGTKQRFIFRTDTLIGITHHFRRYKRFTVGYALVMLDKLRLDVVKRKVDVTGFLALAFHPVCLGVPHVHRHGMLATELCLAPVDCNPSHDGNNTVFLLASVHEEQDFESCSHTPCFFGCKFSFICAKWL